MIDIEEIMKVLPHRYPFLLVDRILEFEEQKAGRRHQERHDQRAVLPGTLSRASDHAGRADRRGDGAGGRHAADGRGRAIPDSKVVYFMSLDNVKFRQPVKPGDQLRFELEMLQVRGKVCRMRGVAKVDGEVVCEAEMAAMVRDK